MSNNKKNNKIQRKTPYGGIICSDMKDHGNDPFVLRKVEASIKIVEKYGLPKEIMDRQKNNPIE